MSLGADLRTIGWLMAILAVLAFATPYMPRAWFADPISEEPRSMMGSGFVNDHPDVGPWTWWWSDRMDLRVDHPEETNIIIWNHHTEAMSDAPSCLGTLYFPPPAVMRLERIGRTRVYYLCTKSTQDPGKPFYALQRSEEILDLVRRFRALGVPPGRIFLAGQSGGSCSSIFALGAGAEEVNAGFLYAPACFAPGEGRKRTFGGGPPERRALEAKMLEAERVEALVVAFSHDRWNKPADMGFLTRRYPESVRLFSPPCAARHGGAFSGCGVDPVAEATRTYFLERLEAAGHPVGEVPPTAAPAGPAAEAGAGDAG